MTSKQLRNGIALAAMMAAAGSALATSLELDTSKPSGGNFIFSNNLLGGYSLISATVGPVSPATVITATDDSLGTVTGIPGATYTAGAQAPITSYTIDPVANTIKTIDSQGGVFQNAPKSTASNGGNLVINNLTYDTSTNVISADVSGANLAGTYTLATTHEAVFTISQIQFSADNGATWTTVPNPATFAVPGPGTYELQASGLFLVGGNSGAVFSQFQKSLGLKGIGLSTLQALDTYNASTNTAGFGTLTVFGTIKAVAPAVPEPSTFALAGLGLAMLASGARLRGRRV